MLNKDFQLITKGGSSRGNRGYSASSPIKIKMVKNKTGHDVGKIYISKYCSQFIGKFLNFYYNEKTNHFAIGIAQNGGVRCIKYGNYGLVNNNEVVKMMYKAYDIPLCDGNLHLMIGKHDEDGNLIIMSEDKFTIIKKIA